MTSVPTSPLDPGRDGDLVIVANRLPLSYEGARGWQSSPGGLVSAVMPVAQRARSTWVGWPGSADAPALAALPGTGAGGRLRPVPLSVDEAGGYYAGYANSLLWPLFHGFPERAVSEPEWWAQYRTVNERFARAASAAAAPDATVWVHDYHLLLVPRLLRELRPDVAIVFFLHIPMAAPGELARLPAAEAEALLAGVSAADLIGVQSDTDREHLRAATGGKARVETFPISIDPAGFQSRAAEADAPRRAHALRKALGSPHRLVLSVDRIDYTKGILERMRAWGALLRWHPEWVGRATLLQILTPTREHLPAYRSLRAEVDAAAAALLREFGGTGAPPLVQRFEHLGAEELSDHYRAADLLAVTSLRDGMNLVAKEFVASRADERGVLLLSRGTGAAAELGEALLVDPRDPAALSAALATGLRMPVSEQRDRMRALRRAVFGATVHDWAAGLLGAAARARAGEPA